MYRCLLISQKKKWDYLTHLNQNWKSYAIHDIFAEKKHKFGYVAGDGDNHAAADRGQRACLPGQALEDGGQPGDRYVDQSSK